MLDLTVSQPSLADAFARTFLARFVRLTFPFTITGTWCLGTPRKPPSSTVVEQVYQRDGLTCRLCGLPGQRDTDDVWTLNLDHIIPSALRGPNHESNLCVTHRWCNSQRQLTPYPTVICAADGGRCRRCGSLLGEDTLIEHVVDLASPAMWDERCAWPCHRACHRPDTWPEVPTWSQPRLPNLLAFLMAPLVILQDNVPEILVQLPPADSAIAPRVQTTLPVRIRRQEEVVTLEWMLPGRFALVTVLTLDEARALARDLLIETCVSPRSTADSSTREA